MVLRWPEQLDWRQWADRFDRMQERYLVGRCERFETIVRMIRAVRSRPGRVLDLGCGTGSLALAVLRDFPGCELVGVDVDESMLVLARPRLAGFGSRVRLLAADLRAGDWTGQVGTGFEAVVSATAMHWLSADSLAALYRRLPGLLAPGGIFLNADHVGSESPAIQDAWQAHREAARQAERDAEPARRPAETWGQFWQAYAAALGLDADKVGEKAVLPWEGVEDGMPLSWHFDRLREAGFTALDCFWRADCDAVYGGIRA